MKKPFIVTIAGGSGSGKSTFAQALVEQLTPMKVSVISTDTFFKRGALPKMVSPRSGQVLDDWNSPESISIEGLMEALRTQIDEKEHDVIIVEGIGALYFQELLDIADLKLFMDLDVDERMYRRIKRNMVTRGLSMEEIADYFLDAAKHSEAKNFLPTTRNADLIIHGDRDFARIAGMIATIIRA